MMNNFLVIAILKIVKCPTFCLQFSRQFLEMKKCFEKSTKLNINILKSYVIKRDSKIVVKNVNTKCGTS